MRVASTFLPYSSNTPLVADLFLEYLKRLPYYRRVVLALIFMSGSQRDPVSQEIDFMS